MADPDRSAAKTCGFVQSQPHLTCVLPPDHGPRHSLYPIEEICLCGHPVGWHRKNVGSCLECGCTVYDREVDHAV